MNFINFDDIEKIMKIILIKMYLFLNMFQIQLLWVKQVLVRRTYYSTY